jgi:hypothetical protein
MMAPIIAIPVHLSAVPENLWGCTFAIPHTTIIVHDGTWMVAELARVGPQAGAVFANAHNLTTCLADLVRNYDSFTHEAKAISRV